MAATRFGSRVRQPPIHSVKADGSEVGVASCAEVALSVASVKLKPIGED